MTHQDIIQSYFAACTSGDAAVVAKHFSHDAEIYDLNHEPIRGAAAIGTFWERTHAQWTGATWKVDSFLGTGDRVAIEWTMRGTRHGAAFVVRGSEHYAFDGDLISQIRQYWIFDRQNLDRSLVGYPYEEAARLGSPKGAHDAS